MKNKEYWIKWIQKAGIRAIKTMSQAALANIGVATAVGQVNWMMVLSTATLAGAISLLSSLKGLPELQLDTEVIKE